MAHFAKIDNNNTVLEVVVVNNDVLLEDGVEVEQKGIDFLNDLLGVANWVKTSYNGSFRKQFGGIGFVYDNVNDLFVRPQPFASWTLDENFDWQPSTPMPLNGKPYQWNEGTLTWDLVKLPQPFNSWTWNETEWEWQPPTPYPTDGQYYEWNEEDQTWDVV